MDELKERLKLFSEQENHIENEINKIINRACEEYAMSICQVVGVLEAIKKGLLR